ncbi:sensor domain-containing diguanylate cyclase [Saccharibacillus sacchari]|uniref:sensor domain-containing diguanylate cyclase n=1 Tax=Saccharibacillus sacchari TaxID=456493 RepID=UPI0004BB3071|nr:diguanylate cyclase [Saccharibacillus sacchari]
MLQLSYNLGSLQEIDSYLHDTELQNHAARSRSTLVQFFASHVDSNAIPALYQRIIEYIPEAIVTGITTAGEIHEGESIMERTVVVFSFFETAELQLVSYHGQSEAERELGRRMVDTILSEPVAAPIKGIQLYATTQRMNAAGLLEDMQSRLEGVPVFGAGASSYHNHGETWIFAGDQVYEEGAAAVVFRGAELEIEVYPCLGWEPLSRAMTITEIESPTLLKTLDGIPAASVYEKYLGIQNDDNFFKNMLEFPLMLKRGTSTLARVPLIRRANGSLQLVADVHVGEQVRITYGSPKHIIEAAYDMQKKLADFRPQGILIYSCYCRQVYLQEGLNLETQGFRQIAPSAGFYTYGEFYGEGGELALHNATMVAVGMREGGLAEQFSGQEPNQVHLSESKPMEMTARLARFVGVVVEELEQANRDLQELMQADSLTGIYNRRKMDELLGEAMSSDEANDSLSIVLLDIDWFKRINDTYGHLCGDEVLKRTAAILREDVCGTGDVGRWGGEEFLLLLRNKKADEAVTIAERIRVTLEQTDFGAPGSVTASFGVTAARPGEEIRQLFKRADDALYSAKHGGRNRVVLF